MCRTRRRGTYYRSRAASFARRVPYTLALMEDVLIDILKKLRTGAKLDDRALHAVITAHSKNAGAPGRICSKRQLLSYYFETRAHDFARWESWDVDEDLQTRLLAVLRMKPRRCASGVASVTVLTKPHPCPGSCIFCPSDLTMPKSYLASEPACQRAEQCCFDPYLQVTSRLRTLYLMGHPVDEVELVVLGGSWTEYPKAYRLWFAAELYRALNDWDSAHIPNFSAFAKDVATLPGRSDEYAKFSQEPWGADDVSTRQLRYAGLHISSTREGARGLCSRAQGKVDAQEMSYDEAVTRLYGTGGWEIAGRMQRGTWAGLSAQMRANETAAARCVGFSVETRPDCVNAVSLLEMARMGCDRLQIGVQSLDDKVLSANWRGQDAATSRRALDLARLFGMRVHVHYMLNLYLSTPQKDLAGFTELAAGGLCDEVKLYPCVLVAGTPLVRLAAGGAWKPYPHNTLLDLCASCMKAAPAWVRMSRMVRDISTDDILAGNKTPNLRQEVDRLLEEEGAEIFEIRHRELGTRKLDGGALHLQSVPYRTPVSQERLLQVVTDDGRLVALARLSFPDARCVSDAGAALPVRPGEAVLRELHVFGAGDATASLAGPLREKLLDSAAAIAARRGCSALVSCAPPGIRPFLRAHGFEDGTLFMRRAL